MDVRVLLQPLDSHGAYSALGELLSQLLRSRTPFYREVWFVSAFANERGLARLLPHIRATTQNGAHFHFVVGVDHQSTTVEALERILALGVDARVIKDARPGRTFHPKIYLFEAPTERAEIILGSSNLTGGGTFSNYEANIQLQFDLGMDAALYHTIRNSLNPFLHPAGPTGLPLTRELIETLQRRGDIVSEYVRRSARRPSRAARARQATAPPLPFGTSRFPTPPGLPDEYLREKVRKAGRQRRAQRAGRPALEPVSLVDVNAFYMHLPKLQGPNIPGEARIPLEARDLALEFWGWPQEYRRKTTATRDYREWKPKWRIFNVATPDQESIDDVRIYYYEQSSDFRFYSSALVDMGADAGDIVRISRCAPGDHAIFECALAKAGSRVHQEWEAYCTQPVRNSNRKFGYA